MCLNQHFKTWTPFYFIDSDILSQCCMGQWCPSLPWHMVHLNNTDMIWYISIYGRAIANKGNVAKAQEAVKAILQHSVFTDEEPCHGLLPKQRIILVWPAERVSKGRIALPSQNSPAYSHHLLHSIHYRCWYYGEEQSWVVSFAIRLFFVVEQN